MHLIGNKNSKTAHNHNNRIHSRMNKFKGMYNNIWSKLNSKTNKDLINIICMQLKAHRENQNRKINQKQNQTKNK